MVQLFCLSVHNCSYTPEIPVV